MAARLVAALAASVLMLTTACSGGDGDDDERAAATDQPTQTAKNPPADVTAELGTGDRRTNLVVSFAPSSDADEHLLTFDGAAPIRIDKDDCDDDTCEVTLDRLTVGAATSLVVTGVNGEAASPPSESVDVPSWPEPELPSSPGAGDPVRLNVLRVGEDDGQVTIATETVAAGEDVAARMDQLASQPGVLGVEIDRPVQPAQSDDPDPDAELPDYPVGLTTWQQEALNFAALPEEPRGSGVTIAVIDGGIQASHPALTDADITTTNQAEPGAEVVADTHATGIASLIVGNPASRIPGIAQGATIHNYDIGSDASAIDIARAIIKALVDGADVISISQTLTCEFILAGMHARCEPEAVRSAIEYAESAGVVVVAGAGNDGDGEGCDTGREANKDSWPAKFPTVIAVGGIDRDGSTWECTPDKDYIDVLAPATNLRIATVESSYGIASGTSFATPLVAGLVAILLADNPDLTPADVRELLASATAGGGRILVSALMASVGIDPPSALDPTTGSRAYPFTMPLSYEPGHDFHALADKIEDMWMFGELDSSGMAEGLDGVTDGANGSATLTFRGLLLVDPDGKVSGWATMEGIYGDWFHGFSRGSFQSDHKVQGFRIGCPTNGPNNEAIHPPGLEFRWDIGATIGGELERDPNTGNISVDLSVSFGEGAKPSEAGVLLGMTIAHDDLDDCEGLLQADAADAAPYDPDWDSFCEELSARACWNQITRARNELVPALEQLHQEIIDAGPITFTGDTAQFSDTEFSIEGKAEDHLTAQLSTGSY